MDPPIIHSIFAIGCFCSADYLINNMCIRGYSSPFSWMDIDLATALEFIETGFQDFTDVIRTTDTVNENGCYEFVHKRCVDSEKICHWTHHDLSNNTVIETLHRRARRLMDNINYQHTLLLYYDKHLHPIEYYKAIVEPFSQKYPCKILIIVNIPELSILYTSDSLFIVSGSLADLNLRKLLNYIFTFNIIPLPTARLGQAL